MVALLTAGCLMLARLFELGFLADFLSQTVLVGFLTGVGFQVGIAMLGEMLGVRSPPTGRLSSSRQVVRGLPQLHVPTLCVAVAVVAIILVFDRLAPRLPGPLFAVVGAIAASAAFDFPAHGIAVIQGVTGGLPLIGLPNVSWGEIPPLLARVGLVLPDDRHPERCDRARLRGSPSPNTRREHRPRRPVGGQRGRGAQRHVRRERQPDADGDGRTLRRPQPDSPSSPRPRVVAFVLLFLTSPLHYLPRCVLGAIVFTIAIGLVDVRGLRDIRRESPGEFRLALITAAVVVVIGVEQGILLAIVLSLLRHVRHSYRPHTAVLVEDGGQWRPTPAVPGALSGPGLVIFQFGADLFYANAGRFAADVRGLVEGAATPVKWLVVDAGAITSVDYSAARVLRGPAAAT